MPEHPRINLEHPVLRDVAILVLEHEQEIAKQNRLLRGTNGGSDGMIADVKDLKRAVLSLENIENERKAVRQDNRKEIRAATWKIIAAVVGGFIVNYFAR